MDIFFENHAEISKITGPFYHFLSTSFSYSTSTGQLEVTQGYYSGKCVGINAETSDNLGAMKANDCATIESTYGLPVVGW